MRVPGERGGPRPRSVTTPPPPPMPPPPPTKPTRPRPSPRLAGRGDTAGGKTAGALGVLGATSLGRLRVSWTRGSCPPDTRSGSPSPGPATCRGLLSSRPSTSPTPPTSWAPPALPTNLWSNPKVFTTSHFPSTQTQG